jgi:chromosome segregation ATPase
MNVTAKTMTAKTMVEPTAAQRLATARAGLARLRMERTAASDRKQQAQAEYDELDAKLQGLFREQDLYGADLGLAVQSVQRQRAEAQRQVSAASADAADLDRRLAAVQSELPRLEAAALQDELAAAVAIGTETARRYRAALEALIESGVELQAELGRCNRLAEGVFSRGAEPRHKLAAHLVDGKEIDRVFLVARNSSDFDAGAVDAATRRLFERWHI